MAAKHNEIIALYHLEHGALTLRRTEFKERYGLNKQNISDLVNRRGKIRQGWSLSEQDNWKSFYFSIPQELWNIAEKVAYEKGWTVEAVICDAVEKQLKYQVIEVLLEGIE